MARAFTRQLGYQPGIQLNPIKDLTDGAALSVFDQTVALIGRFSRGRIDKPFRVNRNNIRALLGDPQSLSISALNEAYIQGYEALQNGARELLIQRLSVPGAFNSWVTFTSGPGSAFAVAASASPTATFSLQHLGCHNDGIKVKVHADTYLVSGVATPNPIITVVVLDANSVELYRIKGSLTQGSTDEFGQSNYLPDVSALFTDLLVWSIPTGGVIGIADDGYGTSSSTAKYAASSTLVAFTEGGTAYSSTEYDAAVLAMQNASEDFGYIISGGSRSVALLTRLADLAYQTNRQFIFDIPGDFTVTAAINFLASLGFGTPGKDHYPQAYWAPLVSLDSLNGNRVIYGTGGAQAGMRCARNANVNAYGLALKNFPVAGGTNGVLSRQQIVQIVALSEQNLSDLAQAKINPVIFATFASGGRYVFSDSLTCAAVTLSYRKLISTAEMSSHLDEDVVRFSRECLQLPQELAITRIQAHLDRLFGYALSSNWLVDTGDANLPPYAFQVQRKGNQPADGLTVEYWLHYDGVNRQTYVQQNIV